MLPIVQRELHLAARRGSFYKTRYSAGAAAGLGGLGALFWADRVWQFSSSPGEFLFAFTAAVATLFCCGAGLFLTVDAISSEKRQGTLGLLFLTELRGADIVLGKLASAGATAVSAFLTIFPIMAISICLGGVTGTQIWRMSGALLALLFVSLALGLLVSAIFENSGTALVLFFLVLLIPTVALGYRLIVGGPTPEWLLIVNPLYPIYAAAALEPSLTDPAAVRAILSLPRDFYWSSIGCIIGTGILWLALASVIVPLSVRENGGSLREKFRLRHRRAKRKMERKPSLLHNHPVVWLSVRDHSSTVVLWVVMTAAGVITWLWNPLRTTGSELAGLVYPLFLHYILKFFIPFQSARLIIDEKEGGLLELLLTTPMNAGVVLASKKAALRRHFLLPLIYTVAVHAIYIWGGILHDPLTAGPWIAFGSMVVLYMDYFTLSWLGLWQGLVAKTSQRAFLRTLLTGLALPWAPFFLLTALLVFVNGGAFDLHPSLLLVWGFASATICGMSAGLYALARVHYNLRVRLAEG